MSSQEKTNFIEDMFHSDPAIKAYIRYDQYGSAAPSERFNDMSSQEKNNLIEDMFQSDPAIACIKYDQYGSVIANLIEDKERANQCDSAITNIDINFLLKFDPLYEFGSNEDHMKLLSYETSYEKEAAHACDFSIEENAVKEG